MKAVLIACFMFLAFQGFSQRYIFEADAYDSLLNATTETTGFTQFSNIEQLGTLFFHVTTTLISGTAAGTIQYQISNDGSRWHTMATDTITTGAATDQSYQLDNFAGKAARIRLVGTGTQLTGYNASIGFKRNY